MVLMSVKNSEKAPDEHILKGRLVDCGHKVFNRARQEVTEQQRAALKQEGLSIRPISGTEWRCAFAVEAATSLQEDYELVVIIVDEKQAYVKRRRHKGCAPRYLLLREPDLE